MQRAGPGRAPGHRRAAGCHRLALLSAAVAHSPSRGRAVAVSPSPTFGGDGRRRHACSRRLRRPRRCGSPCCSIAIAATAAGAAAALPSLHRYWRETAAIGAGAAVAAAAAAAVAAASNRSCCSAAVSSAVRADTAMLADLCRRRRIRLGPQRTAHAGSARPHPSTPACAGLCPPAACLCLFARRIHHSYVSSSVTRSGILSFSELSD